ncbi:MAG: AgmX/PglI C-terminal domain-containing protein, partial [Proteobacteria bacterium]|nr:AgmX/PglI C-terminal domain-containing protein [Pseudomonadota bacterium]
EEEEAEEEEAEEEEAEEEEAEEEAAEEAAEWDDEDTDDTGQVEHQTEDVMRFIMRSGTAQSSLGINTKRPKVLEVNQIWGDLLLDAKHFPNTGPPITIGSSVAWRWEFLGVDMGWIPRPLHLVLAYTPPMWSEVVSDWLNDFYAPDINLPGGRDHTLFVWKNDQYVAEVFKDWDGFVDVGDSRYSFDELVDQGKANKTSDAYEIPITEDIRLMVDVDGVIFFAQKVRPGQRILQRSSEDVDYPFIAIASFIGFLGLMFGMVMYFSPKPPENDLVEIPDRFVNLLLDKPEEKKKEKPKRDPDAGEGEKAKKEEGKVGKKDAKKMKAKGNKIDMKERDRKIADAAGIFSEGLDMGAPDLDPTLAGAIGGVLGAKGSQFGAGGLGSRGSGLGGGGTADGLGGMGTKGFGSGRSGYGKGGGDMGPKGEGGIGTVGGDPIIVGSLDRSLIDEVIKRHMNQIRYCYQRELTKNPSLGGKIVVKFVIAKDGTVSKANIKETTMGNPAVEECVLGRFRRMQFPKPKGGGIVIVSYPFLFSPG